MRFKGTYYCGYCGCDEVLYFIANNENDVLDYMEYGLYDYAEGNAHIAFGWDTEYTAAEFDDFLENDCGYDVINIPEDNLEEFFDEEGIDESYFIDLTKKE